MRLSPRGRAPADPFGAKREGEVQGPPLAWGDTATPAPHLWAGAPQPEPTPASDCWRGHRLRDPGPPRARGAGVVPPATAPGVGVPPGKGGRRRHRDVAFVCRHTLPRWPGPGERRGAGAADAVGFAWVVGTRHVGVAGAARPTREAPRRRAAARGFPAALTWRRRLRLCTAAPRQGRPAGGRAARASAPPRSGRRWAGGPQRPRGL